MLAIQGMVLQSLAPVSYTHLDVYKRQANNLLAAAIDARMFHEADMDDDTLFKRLCPLKGGKRAFTATMVRRLQKLGIDKRNPADLTPEEISLSLIHI